MRILVTGGAGYIGSHTCLELLAAGYDVVALDNLSNARRVAVDRVAELAGRDPPFVEADVRDRAAFEVFRMTTPSRYFDWKLTRRPVEEKQWARADAR